MEDGFWGFCFGCIIGIIICIIILNESGPKISGQYLSYQNMIYKQVSKEELDNIIILEVK